MAKIPGAFLFIVGLVVTGISLMSLFGIWESKMDFFIIVGAPMLILGLIRLKMGTGEKKSHEKHHHHKPVHKVTHVSNQAHPHQAHKQHPQQHAQHPHKQHPQAHPAAHHQAVHHVNFCPACGAKAAAGNFCQNCGRKLR